MESKKCDDLPKIMFNRGYYQGRREEREKKVYKGAKSVLDELVLDRSKKLVEVLFIEILHGTHK